MIINKNYFLKSFFPVSGIKKPLRKKKRVRTSFTTQQLITLEDIFSKTKYIATEYRKELAQSLQLEDKCIKIWFQNRRMKEKKDSADSSSEFSSEKSNISDSSPSPVSFKEETNYEIIIKPKEESPVTGNQFIAIESSDYQVTFNQQMNEQNSAETCYYNNMYPTEYYPSYGSEYYSNFSMQNQNSEYANYSACNVNNGSWYADANNYFYCNN